MDEIRARQIPAEVFQRYQTLRQSYAALAQKITELDVDKSEHETVIKTISGLDPSRKCYRLVGGVLVERTVGEVLPAVQANRDNLATVISKMLQKLQELETEIADLQTKYGLGREPQQQSQGGDTAKKEDKPKSTGVLV